MVDDGARGADPSVLACSVGIMAYNEAANISNAIDSILCQSSGLGHVAELIVVASGCTDETVPIISRISRSEPRVRLMVQEQREGKASAINQFLSAARSPILLMTGADVLLKDGTIDALLSHFQDPQVGMVGGHPIPVNDEGTLLGHSVHILWRLHDRIAREAPKLGEVVAFRNVIPSIPLDTAVDEISIQALISHLGYRLVYEPTAIVYNRGPSTVGDFLKQRRRIYAGHLLIQKQQGYVAPTMSSRRIMRALLSIDAFATPRDAWCTVCAAGLEVLARILGGYDFRRRRAHHVWQMAATTKPHIAEASEVQSQQSVLVFRIIDFHQQELERGTRAGQLLTEQVMRQARHTLGPAAHVSVERSGTVIALVPSDREEAERAAQRLIEDIEATPLRLNGQREEARVRLACGIIAFSQTGHALALSIPAAV